MHGTPGASGLLAQCMRGADQRNEKLSAEARYPTQASAGAFLLAASFVQSLPLLASLRLRCSGRDTTAIESFSRLTMPAISWEISRAVPDD